MSHRLQRSKSWETFSVIQQWGNIKNEHRTLQCAHYPLATQSCTPPYIGTVECLFFPSIDKWTAVHIILCVESGKDKFLKCDPCPSPLLPPLVIMEGLGLSCIGVVWPESLESSAKDEEKGGLQYQASISPAHLFQWVCLPSTVVSLPHIPL